MSVSRETKERLAALEALMKKWNQSINLVAKGEIAALGSRHIADCQQLLEHAPPTASWIDLGSGGGLPGLVVAALRPTVAPPIVLVDADRRKCAFLREAARQLELPVDVRNTRIEDLPDAKYDVISARALAPLDRLLDLSHRFHHANSIAIFPKGARHEEEIALARKSWSFDMEVVESATDSAAAILLVKGPERD